MTPIICAIYASTRKDGMYLYMKKDANFDQLPDALKQLFGRPRLAMTMLLDGKKPLAKADVDDVAKQIEEKGFYLQMPPVVQDEASQLAELNSKLPR